MLQILKLLLLCVLAVAKYANSRKLIEAGEFKAIARANEEALNNVNAAIIARKSTGLSESDDQDNRDRQ